MYEVCHEGTIEMSGIFINWNVKVVMLTAI